MTLKNIFITASFLGSFAVTAQIETPQPSPAASFTQKVGLTDVEVMYSRPSKKNRVIFGDLVPYGKMWRTGANKNTMITTSDMLIFGTDTLEAGTYALFTTPAEGKTWKAVFYTDTENWGTPDKWDESNVALSTELMVSSISDPVEMFTISVDDVTSDGAKLNLTWDKTRASVAFSVPTETTVMATIEKVMAGPSSSDYYAAAGYYLDQKKDMKQALEWVNKSFELRGGETPFWMLRRKALIQAELKDYKAAIATAEKSLELAKKAEYEPYIKMNEASIAEWKKMK